MSFVGLFDTHRSVDSRPWQFLQRWIDSSSGASGAPQISHLSMFLLYNRLNNYAKE